MKLNQTLVDEAIEFIKQRFPKVEDWVGVAAMYLEDGQILLSTAPPALNEAVNLCHETGAICEAHKLNKRITASVCVARDKQGKFYILTPCGVCQERLMIWGESLEVAVPMSHDSSQWQAKKLCEVQPFYWRHVFV